MAKIRIWFVIFTFLANVSIAGMVLELHFDEGEGDQVADTSGAGNDGAIVGAQWTDGKLGNALEFDGAGTHVEVQDSQSLQITDEMTVACWVSFHSLGASGNHDAIIAKASTWSFITFKRSNPAYQFAWWDSVVKNIIPGENKWIVSDWVPEVNTWYHLAVTMKSGDKLLFYRDGEVIKESSYPLAIPAGASKAILIGKGNGATENFEGIIDEVVVFDEALSPEDVKGLMGISSPVQPVDKLGTVWGSLKE